MNLIQSYLKQWHKTYGDYAKLQSAYGFLAVAGVLLAAIIGLFNYNLGQSLLFVCALLVLIFIANGVIWALLNTFVLAKLSPRSSKKPVKR